MHIYVVYVCVFVRVCAWCEGVTWPLGLCGPTVCHRGRHPPFHPVRPQTNQLRVGDLEGVEDGPDLAHVLGYFRRSSADEERGTTGGLMGGVSV